MSEQKKTRIHQVYRLTDGSRVPSVTTILNVLNRPALLDWAWRCGVDGLDYKEVRDNKADIGKLAHYLIMCHLKDEPADVSEYSQQDIDKAENCFLSYLEWEKNHELETIVVEQPLVSEQFKYGGTPDWYGLLDGGATLLDYKTGKAIYPKYFYQLAAYKQLLIENGHKLVDRGLILRIGRDEDEGFEEQLVTNLDLQWVIFSNCLQIYELQKGIRRDKDVGEAEVGELREKLKTYAKVDREAELPIGPYSDTQVLTVESPKTVYEQAQQDMLKAGYVKEIKD